MKPLPEEIYLSPGENLDMSITIEANIAGEDEITLSLMHSSNDIHEDLTTNLIYELFEVHNKTIEYGETAGRYWKIDLTVPYPYSQSSGNLTLRVRDSRSGDITSTRLLIVQEEDEDTPFFDPAPKSVEAFTNDDVFVNAQARGSSPLTVSIEVSF